jgi:hypothetical protein
MAGAEMEDIVDPAGERRGIADRAVLDGPFQAVTVAEGTDRDGWRKPSEEPLQRRAGESEVPLPPCGGGGRRMGEGGPV